MYIQKKWNVVFEQLKVNKYLLVKFNLTVYITIYLAWFAIRCLKFQWKINMTIVLISFFIIGQFVYKLWYTLQWQNPNPCKHTAFWSMLPITLDKPAKCCSRKYSKINQVQAVNYICILFWCFFSDNHCLFMS